MKAHHKQWLEWGQIVGLIACWYGANIGMTILNRAIPAVYGFKYPLFSSFVEMAWCAAFGALSQLKYPAPPLHNTRPVILLAALFSAAVGFGNVSLVYIPVSFNQALYASTPVFTAAFDAMALRNYQHWQVYASLVPIVMGIVIASNAEPMYNTIGVTTALLATAARSLKTVLQQTALAEGSGHTPVPTGGGGGGVQHVPDRAASILAGSIALNYYVSQYTAVLLGLEALLLEPQAFAQMGSISAGVWGLLAAGGLFAYLANLLNYVLTSLTSALTLQVCGNAKGALAAFISVLIFRNPVTPRGAFGFGVALAGLGAYVYLKQAHKKD